MKTDDDEQSQTRQEDIHEDPEREKQTQTNQDDSSQTGEEGGRRLDARLSIQAIFFLCDGHRLVEDCVLEQVPLDKKDRRGHEAGGLHLSIQCSPHPRALTALSL